MFRLFKKKKKYKDVLISVLTFRGNNTFAPITGLVTVPWPTNFDHILECGKLLIESQKIENVIGSMITSFTYVSDVYKK